MSAVKLHSVIYLLANIAKACALFALGAFFIFNAQKFFGDWHQANRLTRLVRRSFGAPIIMRLVGVMWIVFGAVILFSTVRGAISN